MVTEAELQPYITAGIVKQNADGTYSATGQYYAEARDAGYTMYGSSGRIDVVQKASPGDYIRVGDYSYLVSTDRNTRYKAYTLSKIAVAPDGKIIGAYAPGYFVPRDYVSAGTATNTNPDGTSKSTTPVQNTDASVVGFLNQQAGTGIAYSQQGSLTGGGVVTTTGTAAGEVIGPSQGGTWTNPTPTTTQQASVIPSLASTPPLAPPPAQISTVIPASFQPVPASFAPQTPAQPSADYIKLPSVFGDTGSNNYIAQTQTNRQNNPWSPDVSRSSSRPNYQTGYSGGSSNILGKISERAKSTKDKAVSTVKDFFGFKSQKDDTKITSDKIGDFLEGWDKKIGERTERSEEFFRGAGGDSYIETLGRKGLALPSKFFTEYPERISFTVAKAGAVGYSVLVPEKTTYIQGNYRVTEKRASSDVFTDALKQTPGAALSSVDVRNPTGAVNLIATVATLANPLAQPKFSASKPRVEFGDLGGVRGEVTAKPGSFTAVGETSVKTTVRVGKETFVSESPVNYALQGTGELRPVVSGEVSSLVSIPEKSVSVFGQKVVTRPASSLQVSERLTGSAETIYASSPSSKTFTVGGEKVVIRLKDPSSVPKVESVGTRVSLITQDASKVFISESRIVKNVNLDLVTPVRNVDPVLGTRRVVKVSDASRTSVLDEIKVVAGENKAPGTTPLDTRQTYRSTTQVFERNKAGRLQASNEGKGIGVQETTEFNRVDYVSTGLFDQPGFAEQGRVSGTQLSVGDLSKVGGASKGVAERGFKLLDKAGLGDERPAALGPEGSALRPGFLTNKRGSATPGSLVTEFAQESRVSGGRTGGVSDRTPIVSLEGYKLSNVPGQRAAPTGGLIAGFAGSSTVSVKPQREDEYLPELPSVTMFNPSKSRESPATTFSPMNAMLPAIDSDVGTLPAYGQSTRYTPATDRIVLPATDTTPAQKPAEKTMQEPVTDQMPLTDQITDQITDTPPTFPPFRPGMSFKPEVPEVPVPPVMPTFGSSSKKKKRKEFDVFVRKRGQFVQVNNEGLDLTDAARLGSGIVTSSSAASFKIRERNGGGAPDTSLASQYLNPTVFTRSKSDRNVFVQRAEKRISSQGEKIDITYKGIAASRNKRRGGFSL